MTKAIPAIFAALLVTPAFAGDADHGEVLARQVCASCHVVAEDEAREVGNAPSFTSIANRQNFDPAAVARFLRDSHAKAPDTQLSPYEADDLAAYIAGLRK